MEEVNPNHLPFELTKEFIEDIRLLIENQANEEILLKLDELFPADITSILIELTTEEAKYLVLLIDTKIAAEIISTLDADDRKKFLKHFTSKEIAAYINVIDSDDAVDILNEQPVKVREEVIALLKDREQARFIIDLMHYDEDCAGGLMQKELIKINISQTVTECVEEIRKAKRGSKIADVYEDDEIVSVQTYASGEEVADLMQKYDLEAIPVVNIQGRLLGRITIDDVVDFITESAQEDIQVMAGISEDVEEDDSVWLLVRSRLPWLIGGMVGSFLAAKIIDRFDDTISVLPAISAFIPLIGSTGGNVGIQSSSLIVQSLADKSGLDTTLWKRLQKVLLVALINALIAAIFAFGCSLLVDSGQIMLSMTVSISLFAVVMLASLMGTITPLVLNQLKINPAVASGPSITTTNDILGYGVYFMIVYLLL